MSDLDLDFTPEPPSSRGSIIAARHRRALVAGIVGDAGRDARVKALAPQTGARPALAAAAAWAPVSESTSTSVSSSRSASATRRLGGGPVIVSTGESMPAAGPVGQEAARASRSRARPELAEGDSGVDSAASRAARASERASTGVRSTPLQLDGALVVPAGAMLRGYVRARALLLAGDIVGNVHCTAGPVVVRAGATLKGRIVAVGDVYVCGCIGDSGGGAVISTRGKVTLAPGARVDGDIRSGRLDLYDGAMLNGLARGYED